MAHRKPLGTTCRTTADWYGDDPFPLDFLVTPADTWYRVVGIEETRSMREAMELPVAERSFKIKLTLERVARPPELVERHGEPIAVADHETGRLHLVHEFHWYERKRALPVLNNPAVCGSE